MNKFLSTKTHKILFKRFYKQNSFSLLDKNKFSPAKNVFDSSGDNRGKIDFYELQEPILFSNDRFLVIKADKQSDRVVWMFDYGCKIGMLFFSYMTLKSLYNFRPFRTIFYGAFTAILAKLNIGMKNNKNYIIREISLLKDGRSVEILTPTGKRIVDISKIRRMNTNENTYFGTMFGDVSSEYVPVIVDNSFYLLPKYSLIPHKDIFAAITLGKYIKLRDDQKIQKEQSIDIEINENKNN
jgi:hypothetical protein